MVLRPELVPPDRKAVKPKTMQGLTPSPEKLESITDAEYLEIIKRLQTGQATGPQIDYWLRLLDINIPCPNISDLIYCSKEEMTAEQVLAKARQWRPIIL